jgi:hypothetical protein
VNGGVDAKQALVVEVGAGVEDQHERRYPDSY